MSPFAALASLAGLALAMAVVPAAAVETKTGPGGLKYQDVVVGTGPEAKAGQQVEVHYTGWLDKDGAKGAKFDSSVDRNDPFVFQLGAGMVIEGWDKGVAGMKVGGKRTLMIPPDYGYGDRRVGPIPAGSSLVFDVELLDVKP